MCYALANIALACILHRDRDGRIPTELVARYLKEMKSNITEDFNFDAADTIDGQKRTLLTIAEGSDVNSALSQLVREMILFHKLYKINRKDPHAHQSRTCIVTLAEDCSDAETTAPVALKFMRNKDQFERELTVREGLDNRFVIDVIGSYNSNSDVGFAEAIKSFGNGVYAEYQYCIVLPRAARGLHEVITHDHIAGVPSRILDVKAIVGQIAEALQHFYETGIIHAVSLDILPLDPLRISHSF
jgi:serine/threonine protein kinase